MDRLHTMGRLLEGSFSLELICFHKFEEIGCSKIVPKLIQDSKNNVSFCHIEMLEIHNKPVEKIRRK